MTDFFKYYTEINKEVVFQNFDRGHSIALIILLVCMLIGFKIIKSLKKETANKVLKVLAILVPIVELTHTYWLYTCGETSIVKLLPFHICSISMITIPLAMFTNNVYIKEYVFAYSVIGGIFGVSLPSGVSGSYPIIHFQTIQTIIFHGLIVFVPLAMIVAGVFKPNIKNLRVVHIIYFIIAVCVGLFDYVFGENYMFLMYPPEVGIAEWVYSNFGLGIYIVIHFITCFVGSYIAYIPGLIIEKVNTRKNEKKIENNIDNENERIEG